MTIQIIGDSTGINDGTTNDQANSWPGLLGSLLGAVAPTYTVSSRLWSDANQNYPTVPDVTIQSGSGGLGARYYDLRNNAALQLPSTVNPGGSPAGDIDIRVKLNPNTWGAAAIQDLFSQWESSTNQRSVIFYLGTDKKLNLAWSTNGTGAATGSPSTSTVAVPFADGTAGWCRVTHQVNDGSAHNLVKFYTSTDGVTWTQLGTTITNAAGTTSHFVSTALYTLAGHNFAGGITEVMTGQIHKVHYLAGIGGYDLLPWLPEDWDPIVNGHGGGFGGDGFTIHGDPIIEILNGSMPGQGVSYFDANATRRAALSPNIARLVLVNTSINDAGLWSGYAVGTFKTWIQHLQTNIPNVPIIVLGQHPVSTGASVPLQDNVDQRYARAAALAQMAETLAGVWPLDMFPAFPANFTSSLYGDGYLHPSLGINGGHGVIANWIKSRVFS